MGRSSTRENKTRYQLAREELGLSREKASELLAQLPTRTQMDELLKAAKYLERLSEQAGKRNEKRFSLPGIRLPRLSLPDIPWTSLLLGLEALALTGLVLWVVWSSLDTLWSAARGLLP